MNDQEMQPAARDWRTAVLWLTAAGLVLALAGGVYLRNETGRLRNEILQLQAEARARDARLNEASAGLAAARDQFEALASQISDVNQKAGTALQRARSEARLRANQLDEQRQANDEMARQVTELKQTTSAVSNDVNGVKTDVSGVRTSVAGVRSDVDKTAADLKKVTGDMGVMSGLIATNAKQLQVLRELGERNYYEFTLTKSKTAQKVGDIRLLLKKTDAKRSRYTMQVLADDKQVEKKDRTINEPVQLYVGGSRQPYEIVVNQVTKNQVAGYLATPKNANVARR